jgi:L-iditol 2-dehydrogenase
MDYEEAVMTEPLSSVFSCQEYANVTLGDTVAVIGMGPIGCLQLELAKLRGAKRVIAIEPSKIRLDKALGFGADYVINPLEEDPVKKVREITQGWGAEVVISANPSTKAQDQAIKMACKRGKVVFFGGVPKGEMTLIDSNFVHYEQITILGHFGYDHMQNARSFDLIADKKIKAKRYVTHVMPLEEIMKGLELARSGEAIKVVLKP